ncbi:phosphopantetheine-binding protein [Streptomyces sp. NPDC059002]|uniref:phosphopantetheine-binding protein n=1 Tax=Streptomyces sp. NPDC059002 TaxID=3346690 RepID=UPI0036C61D2B
MTIDEFVELVGDETGLPVTPDDAALGFDQLPGWDSLQLLVLLSALERETGRRVSLPQVLESGSLADIYRVVTAEA